LNKDIIHNAIENPELTLGKGVDDLEKISSQYPYFGAAQLLLTKAYQRSNDYRYTDQLHQAAIYSTDRKHLYDWIKAKHQVTVQSPSIVEQEVLTKETVAPVFIEESKPTETVIASEENVAELVSLLLDDEILPTKAKQEPSTLVKPEAITSEVEKSTPEILPVKEEPIGEAQAELIEEIPASEQPKVRASEFDSMEKEILLEAMQSSIELEVSEVEEEENIAVKQEKTEEGSEEEMPSSGSFASWIYHRSRQVHFSDEVTEKPSDTEPLAVSDWRRTAPQPAAESDIEDFEDEIPAEESRNLSHGIKKLSPATSKPSQQDLIDRFIQFEPKITPGKALEYTSGNLAKESLEEDLSFVTETMAILFAKQGKPDKARKAFKKLMELHPEKSVYFAAQLKNLDKYKK